MSYNPFCLDKLYPASTPLKEYLHSIIKSADYKKGELLLKEGRFCQRAWWLRSGLVRYYYQLNNRDVSHFFIGADAPVLAPDYARGSDLGIQAVEDCSTWFIDEQELNYACRHFPETLIMRRLIADRYYQLLDTRLRMISLRRSIDRYRLLSEQRPDLLQRVSLGQLASYLDLEIHTLSRIRKKLLR